MNTNSHNQLPTMGEFMHKSKLGGAKAIVVAIVVIFLLIGIIYTGIHNYNLFSRGLHGDQAVFAMIPVVLLEGSILLALAGSFVWFSGGAQKMFASGFGWVLFLIVAANTVVDSMLNSVKDMPPWLAIYSQFFLWATPVAVMAAWKLILDLDPAKRSLDQQKAIEHALAEAKFAAAQKALMSDANREALADFGDAFGANLAAHIRQSAPALRGQPQAPVIEGETTPVDDKVEYAVGQSRFRNRSLAEAVAKEWGKVMRIVERDEPTMSMAKDVGAGEVSSPTPPTIDEDEDPKA